MGDRRLNVDESAARDLGLRLELDLARSLLAYNPDHLEALKMLGDALTRSGEHADALRIDRRITVLAPRDPVVRYNLACSCSNVGRIDEALIELAASIRMGYREYDHMLRDPDLANVRRDPRFKRLIARLKRIQQ